MLINRASLPAEFYEITSARMLLQPQPQFLHGRLIKMALGVSLGGVGSLGLPIPGRSFGTNGADYASANDGRLILSDGIYDQSVMVVGELGKQPGHTIKMNRPVFRDTVYTQASREVASGKTISVIPSSVRSEQTSITIRRFAGPYDSDQNAVGPIGVERFDGNFMLHQPAKIASADLVNDFDKTLDKFGVLLFDQAATIVRPGTNFTTDNDHTAQGDGPMTWALLQRLERVLDEASIPYFPNGKRAVVLHPRQVEQLTLDPVYQRLTRYEQKTNPFFHGTYVGEVGNWVIFKSVTLTKIVNGSGVTVYYGQAFGPGAVGAALAMLPEVRHATQDNYGETALLIWLMYAGFEVLDTRFIASVRTT